MYFLKHIKRWIVVSFALFSFPLLVQAQLILNGQFRPRTEYRNGYRTLRTASTDPAFFTSQRSRLTLKYKTDLYELKVAGQDVRVWGGVEQLQDNPNVNIHEVWAKLNVSESLDLKMGRQELIYDDQRLLGSVNWTQQARSHDALILQYHNADAGLTVDLGGAYNQEAQNLLGNTYTLNNYKVLSYVWLHRDFGPLKASALGLTDGFQQSGGSTNFRYTYGTHLNYQQKEVMLSGSIYLQNGDDNLRNNISAWMYALKAGYSRGALQLTAGYDFISGGGADDANPRRHAFNTLYATNHKFYGHMDYFLNVPGDSRFGGLQDLYLRASYNLADHSHLSLTYHNFALAKTITDPNASGQTLDKPMGSEMDFNITHNFTADVAVKAGYSMMLPAETLERIQQKSAEPVQHWGWIMLSITPSFLN